MINKKKAGRPVGTTGKARAITDKELLVVLAVAEKNRNAKRNIAALILSNYLGLRAGELSALKIGDVLDNSGEIAKTLRLIASYAKNGRHRDLSLENVRVISAVEDYIIYRKSVDGIAFNYEAPLFRSQQGVNFSANSMARLLITMYLDAGIENASSHTGRRSLITSLAYKGVDIFSIARIAGHASVSTTMLYVQDDPARLRNILMGV
jgi:integrase/recombinase XerD